MIIRPKSRSTIPLSKYQVGDILHHKIFNYRFTILQVMPIAYRGEKRYIDGFVEERTFERSYVEGNLFRGVHVQN